MKKKSIQEESKPILQKSQANSVQQLKTQADIKKKEDDRKTFLPVAGVIITFVSLAIFAFNVLLMLRVDSFVSWDYWSIFSPILLALFVLLILTQSRTVSTRFPLISRLAWLMCVICMIAFIIMLVLKLEAKDILFALEYKHVFIPLWILFGTSFVLGIAAVVVALAFSDTERRKSKYLTSGIPLLFGNMVFFPFVLLVSFKVTEAEGMTYPWAYVFIPLFIADGFFICISAFLLLFTVGARDSALFTIGQISCFLFSLPAAIVFKVLLVLQLDGHPIPFYIVCVPSFIAQAMFLSCGLHLIFNSPKNPRGKDMA